MRNSLGEGQSWTQCRLPSVNVVCQLTALARISTWGCCDAGLSPSGALLVAANVAANAAVAATTTALPSLRASPMPAQTFQE